MEDGGPARGRRGRGGNGQGPRSSAARPACPPAIISAPATCQPWSFHSGLSFSSPLLKKLTSRPVAELGQEASHTERRRPHTPGPSAGVGIWPVPPKAARSQRTREAQEAVTGQRPGGMATKATWVLEQGDGIYAGQFWNMVTGGKLVRGRVWQRCPGTMRIHSHCTVGRARKWTCILLH